MLQYFLKRNGANAEAITCPGNALRRTLNRNGHSHPYSISGLAPSLPAALFRDHWQPRPVHVGYGHQPVDRGPGGGRLRIGLPHHPGCGDRRPGPHPRAVRRCRGIPYPPRYFWQAILITLPIHALSEALVVMPSALIIIPLAVVGGNGLHHCVDGLITLLSGPWTGGPLESARTVTRKQSPAPLGFVTQPPPPVQQLNNGEVLRAYRSHYRRHIDPALFPSTSACSAISSAGCRLRAVPDGKDAGISTPWGHGKQ